MGFFVSCSTPTPDNTEILFQIQKACAGTGNNVCFTDLRTVHLDLYKYHCHTILLRDSEVVLEVNGMLVQPKSDTCPVGSMEVSTKEIPDRCLAFVDNGDGEWGYNDESIEQFCISPQTVQPGLE